MAIVPLTPADLRMGDGATLSQGIAGGAMSPGDFLYKDDSDGGKYKKAINTSLAESNVVAVSCFYAIADQPTGFIVINPGVTYITVNAGTPWIQGLNYVLGDTAGQLMLASDLTAGQFHTMCGVAKSATELLLYHDVSGLVA